MMLIVYRTLDQGKSMATRYRLSLWRRLLNHLVRALLRVELGPRRTYLLTVQGCQTGRPYSTPVTLVEEEGQRWLVAPYGVVGWVRKARPAGRAMLRRGRRTESGAMVEFGPADSAPVLKRDLTEVPITRPFFHASPDAPLDAFQAEAARHPVFHMVGPDA